MFGEGAEIIAEESEDIERQEPQHRISPPSNQPRQANKQRDLPDCHEAKVSPGVSLTCGRRLAAGGALMAAVDKHLEKGSISAGDAGQIAQQQIPAMLVRASELVQ